MQSCYDWISAQACTQRHSSKYWRMIPQHRFSRLLCLHRENYKGLA